MRHQATGEARKVQDTARALFVAAATLIMTSPLLSLAALLTPGNQEELPRLAALFVVCGVVCLAGACRK